MEVIAEMSANLIPCPGRSASRMNATSYRRPGFFRTRCRSHQRPMSSRPRPLVLVVDDCDCMRAVLKVVLRERAGIHAVGAATSEEALRLAQRRKFDAVISDIARPGMDGLAFLEAFKRAHPTLPVIIASGILDGATARRARWLRAFDCLPKPFDSHEIITMVRSALASRRVCRTVWWSCRSSRWER
jgi:DNA-binding NarL/FixJ family response regulator